VWFSCRDNSRIDLLTFGLVARAKIPSHIGSIRFGEEVNRADRQFSIEVLERALQPFPRFEVGLVVKSRQWIGNVPCGPAGLLKPGENHRHIRFAMPKGREHAATKPELKLFGVPVRESERFRSLAARAKRGDDLPYVADAVVREERLSGSFVSLVGIEEQRERGQLPIVDERRRGREAVCEHLQLMMRFQEMGLRIASDAVPDPTNRNRTAKIVREPERTWEKRKNGCNQVFGGRP